MILCWNDAISNSCPACQFRSMEIAPKAEMRLTSYFNNVSGQIRIIMLFGGVKSWSLPATEGLFSLCVHHCAHASACGNMVRGQLPMSHVIGLKLTDLSRLAFPALRFQVRAAMLGFLYMGSDGWPRVLNTCMVSTFFWLSHISRLLTSRCPMTERIHK